MLPITSSRTQDVLSELRKFGQSIDEVRYGRKPKEPKKPSKTIESQKKSISPEYKKTKMPLLISTIRPHSRRKDQDPKNESKAN